MCGGCLDLPVKGKQNRFCRWTWGTGELEWKWLGGGKGEREGV